MHPFRVGSDLNSQDLGIRTRLRLLVAIAVAGLALFACVTYVAIGEVRAGSTAFLHNRIALEVARDYSSPSQSLISIYPFFFQSRNVSGPADIERLRSLLLAAHVRLQEGHKHYLEVLSPGRVRDLVTGEAYQTAEAWFTIAEKEYMPAVERGEMDRANTVRREKMEPLFVRNSAVNEEISALTTTWIAANRNQVADTVQRRTWQLMAVGAATLITQLLLGVLIDARVGASTRILQTTVEELRRKNAEVEAFVYIVSHDLRAPLVNLQGFSHELENSCADLKEVMRRLPLPEDAHARVGRILDSDVKGAVSFIAAASSRLERLIDSLLQLSRQGRQSYKLTPIDTRSLVENTLAALALEIEQAGASFLVEDLPSFHGDYTAVGVVFTNLLTNALRYRDPCRPLVVRVGGQREMEMVHIWVNDNGVGIPAVGISRLFKVFQRLHPALASGEGMGLAIVQRILERHEGKVWAESTEGMGSTFHFRVPFSKPLSFPTVVKELNNHG
jgi:signal transduction histidine kinase